MRNTIAMFRAGDVVYRPMSGTSTFTVKDNEKTHFKYPLRVGGRTYTTDGFFTTDEKQPQLFHATPENQKALEQLYGCGFDYPPRPLTNSQIVLNILQTTKQFAVCQVSNTTQAHADADTAYLVVIEAYRPESEEFVDSQDNTWDYVALACADIVCGGAT